MKAYSLHITISVLALLLALGHLLYPSVRIDAVTLALLVIAILPWLGSVFRSVELPGGLKVEYKELEKAKEKAEQAGLLETPTDRKEEPGYIAAAQHDPNLALAGLRIEIEKRLRTLAQQQGVGGQNQGIGVLMRNLRTAGAIKPQEDSVLRDLIGLLNEAVHGADVDLRAAQWAIEVGPQLLASLDKRVS